MGGTASNLYVAVAEVVDELFRTAGLRDDKQGRGLRFLSAVASGVVDDFVVDVFRVRNPDSPPERLNRVSHQRQVRRDECLVEQGRRIRADIVDCLTNDVVIEFNPDGDGQVASALVLVYINCGMINCGMVAARGPNNWG